jgi:hypothetical protein
MTPNQRASGDGGTELRFQLERDCPAVSEHFRSSPSGRGLAEGHFDRGLRCADDADVFIRAIRVIRG